MSLNNISKDDDDFLKDFLKSFYQLIVKLENYDKFEIIKNILNKWVLDFFCYNKKDFITILNLMEHHKENENWFSGLIGYFYEHDLIDVIDKNKALNLYLLSFNNNKNNDDDDDYKSKELTSKYQLFNIIISKFLLSFYYYKDIILDKNDFILKKFKYFENVHVISHEQFEDFNGLVINICKDEIDVIEEYFESKEKYLNENQLDYDKKKGLIELNNLG
ncbi:unnamed protein product [Rhizophagus irregularis]|nr:unnamed protein product [Rhizophagus irregularis]